MSWGKKAHQAITELDHIDLVSLVADICHLRGAKATNEVGNPEIAGDVLSREEFPFPQSVAIVCYGDVLTEDRLADYFQTHETSPAGDLAVVLQQPPSDGTIEFAESHNIALYDPVDLTDELLMFSATDALSEYAESFDTSGSGRTEDQQDNEESENEGYDTIPSSKSNKELSFARWISNRLSTENGD